MLASAPNFKVIDPEYGDITADVAAELVLIEQEQEVRDFAQAAARQRHIARTMGTEARTFKEGHMVAQIDQYVYDYWERREGKGFWKDKANRERFLKKNPECRVRARTGRTVITVPAMPTARPNHTGLILDARGRAAA
jgi:hypothetical protein